MKYEQTKPCKTCPFWKGTDFRFPKMRARQILDGASFSCHKTTTEKGRDCTHTKAQACAGRMIVLERGEQPDQMMRTAERLGIYDRTKLDMEADVFESPQAWFDHVTEGRA